MASLGSLNLLSLCSKGFFSSDSLLVLHSVKARQQLQSSSLSCSIREPLVSTAVVSEKPTSPLTSHGPSLLSELPLPQSFETTASEDSSVCLRSSESPLDGEQKEAGPSSSEFIGKEISRRRNFAIISHPDAGKTTLTEKLLLYGGAIHEAGAVKARRAARHATSDWMELEKQRGISITSTALVFETEGRQITLLDTPGHQDFGEDTYRTLAAADNAVMLIDAGKGLEPQTRKLFEVCQMRKLPVFTFINKMDRPALQPLELLDEIEKEFELSTHAVNWPIGSGDRVIPTFL